MHFLHKYWTLSQWGGGTSQPAAGGLWITDYWVRYESCQRSQWATRQQTETHTQTRKENVQTSFNSSPVQQDAKVVTLTCFRKQEHLQLNQGRGRKVYQELNTSTNTRWVSAWLIFCSALNQSHNIKEANKKCQSAQNISEQTTNNTSSFHQNNPLSICFPGTYISRVYI